MYVTGIKKNLISMFTMADHGLNIEFVQSQCVVKGMHDHYKFVIIGVRFGVLYKLDVTRRGHQAFTSISMSNEELVYFS